MSTHDDLQQQLGELIHGCLPAAEAARLCERITSDGRVARAYAEAKQAADAGLKNGTCAAPTACCGTSDASGCHSPLPAACAASRSSRIYGVIALAAVIVGGGVLFFGFRSLNRKGAVGREELPLRLTARLSTNELQLGDTAKVQVELENVSGESQPMTVVVLGLPAGLSPRYEQIDALAEQGRFASYELRDSIDHEIAFYWRGVPATARDERAIRFSFDVVAETPGRSTGPASHTYLVYTSKKKHWAKPLTVEIVQ